MKLNKKGWEFNEMVVMTAILFILLGIAAFYIYRLYSTFNANVQVPLVELEQELRLSAREYYYDNNLDDNAIITYKELREEGYIESFYKSYGVDCNGYVVKNIIFESYIKCDNIMTSGYNENYD